MISSLVYFFAGLGFLVFSLALLSVAGFCVAVYLGAFPALTEKLKRLRRTDDVPEKPCD